jgi:F0F1-type ATP synthase epsilon subunit
LEIKGEKDLAFSIEGGFASFEKNQMVIAVDSGEEEELKPKKA